MKKILAVLLSTAFFPILPAHAETGITGLNAKQSGSNIEISGSITDMVSPYVQYTILKPGVSSAEEESLSDSAMLIGQSGSVDENGAFSFSVSIGSRAESGDYTVVLNTLKGGTEAKTVFSYFSDDDRSEMIDVFNSGSESQIYNALADSDNKELIESFGINLDLYTSMTENGKRRVCSLIAQDYTGMGTYAVSSIGTAFNIITAYTDIVNASGSEIFNKLRANSGILGISTEDMTDDNLVAEYVRSVPVSDKLSGFVLAFNRAKAVSAINNTISYMDIYSVLEKYNDVFGISFQAYNSLSASAQINVCKAMIGTYTTPENVKQSFNIAVSSALSSTVTSGGGGGGGGGISASTGASYAGLTTAMAGSNVGAAPAAAGIPEIADAVLFRDISGVPWAEEAINSLAQRGIVNGVSDGIFEPDRSITRAEFVKLVVLAFGIGTEGKKCSYSDVSDSDWYYEYVAAATESGIVNGMPDGSFGAAQSITREDLAVIAYRAADYAGIESVQGAEPGFSDSESISDYAAEAVASLAAAGIINGMDDNCFEPASPATRAQAAKIIYMLEGLSEK